MKPAPRHQLQGLATACVLIAAKMHECSPPSIAQLCAATCIDSDKLLEAVRLMAHPLSVLQSLVFRSLVRVCLCWSCSVSSFLCERFVDEGWLVVGVWVWWG